MVLYITLRAYSDIETIVQICSIGVYTVLEIRRNFEMRKEDMGMDREKGLRKRN